jgi:GH25 family lysozyme M1 (1,4-beta-N-acetylmuramidase)
MKKISKILSIILVAIIMMQTSLTAFATSKTSSIFNSNTYTHQTKYDDYKITQGVDLSYYNGDVDFAKIKKAGVDFVILRVGYRGYGTTGTLCYDSKF